MDAILAKIGSIGLVPVIKLDSADKAPGLGRALVAGGLPVAEITFRTKAAADSIRALRAEVPGLLVGAGTVLNLAQARSALEAGASFIVSPGFDEAVVDFCLERGLPVLPGVTGPDGIMRGLAKGLEVLKFFPAEAAGGVKMLKSLAGPYAHTGVRFIPLGGVNAANMATYLALPGVAAIGGSWMVERNLIVARDWTQIGTLTREALAQAKAV